MNYDDLDNNHAIVNYLISTTKYVIWKHGKEVKYNNTAMNFKDIILSLKRSIEFWKEKGLWTYRYIVSVL